MRFVSKLVITILFVLFYAHSVSAQTVTLTSFATLSGTTENEQLGTILRKADLNNDGKPELFIGAPGFGSQVIKNQGRIYLISMPVESDSSLSNDHVVLQGSLADESIGRFFQLGDFNGDDITDIVTWNPYQNNNSGLVSIYYGPFTQGVIRASSSANVKIAGITNEQMGSSVAVVRNDEKDGLLIGANGFNEYAGRVYYFDDVTVSSQLTDTDAKVIFNGSIGFDLFGSTVQSLGDINGDTFIDFAVSSSKHTYNLALQGATYLFMGPFTEAEYDLSDAAVTLFGRTQNTLWAGKIFNHGDLNDDGIADFSLGSDGDGTGVIALFMGRTVWADSIQIGNYFDDTDQHQIITTSGASGFGFSVDFNGDYNFDGKHDFIFGARYTNTNVGRAYVTNSAGASAAIITGGISNTEGYLGTQVLHLGSINTINVDPYNVDDLVISAPGAYSTTKQGSVKTGVLSFFTGALNPPRSALTASNGITVKEIGDSVRVTITSTAGSRPIVVNRLRILKRPKEETSVKDSVDFPIGESNTSTKWFKLDKSGSFELEHYITDDFGISATSTLKLYFGAVPQSFNLLSDYNNTLLIEGDRTTTISFESEASADTNGASLIYEFFFGLEEESFTTGSGLNLKGSSGAPKFSITYQDLNNYLISSGFLNLNTEGTIYWSIRVRNRQNEVYLFSKMAENGPRSLTFKRMGLDPYFDISSGKARMLLIEGLSTDFYEFKWSSLITENPNAIVDYRFALVKDTTETMKANPVLLKYSEASDNNTFKLFYDELTYLIQNEGVFDQAKDDTLHWFYTVEAIIDGDEDNPWLPKQRYQKADIKYSILIDTSVEEDQANDIPEKFEIYPNYPNPFNPTTQLKFAIPEAGSVKIVVFNMLGQTVYSWSSSGLINAGFHEHTIRARDWSSGIYIYQIQVGNSRLTGKMSLVK